MSYLETLRLELVLPRPEVSDVGDGNDDPVQVAHAPAAVPPPRTSVLGDEAVPQLGAVRADADGAKLDGQRTVGDLGAAEQLAHSLRVRHPLRAARAAQVAELGRTQRRQQDSVRGDGDRDVLAADVPEAALPGRRQRTRCSKFEK